MYIVFEGPDGCGKSTTMKAVAEALPTALDQSLTIHQTFHPGSTPLGTHLRQLVKFPEKIDPTITIDPLSRQLLYMVDTVSFIKQRLEPALAIGETVFADRSSFISALAYGMAEGLTVEEVSRLFGVITPPQMDRLYILSCPWQVCRERLLSRPGQRDHWERKADNFFQRLEGIYNRLIAGPPERTVLVSNSVQLRNIIYVDSTLPLARVVDTIVKDLTTVCVTAATMS